jgi:hypothetical protein
MADNHMKRVIAEHAEQCLIEPPSLAFSLRFLRVLCAAAFI